MRMLVYAAVGLFYAGAALAETSTAPTVSYFAAHPGEQREQMRACANDPGTARHVPACTNAYEAGLDRAAREAKARADASYQAQLGQRQSDVSLLVNKLKFCNALADPIDRRMQGCPAAYAQAQAMRAKP
jgi:hypothetical protein